MQRAQADDLLAVSYLFVENEENVLTIMEILLRILQFHYLSSLYDQGISIDEFFYLTVLEDICNNAGEEEKVSVWNMFI